MNGTLSRRRVCVGGVVWLWAAWVWGQAADPAAEVTVEKLKPHVEILASAEFGGRRGEGALRTAEYLKQQFELLQLRPAFNQETSYLQAIPLVDIRPAPAGKLPPDNHPKPQAAVIGGYNVAALLPGRDAKLADEYIVVSAHYDHLGVHRGKLYPGADDNASGVSMVLELGRLLAALPQRPARSILLVGFDLEERRMLGSYHFAAHPPVPIEQIKLFITADMIGRNAADLATEDVFVVGSEHAPLLRTMVEKSRLEKMLRVGYFGVDLIGDRSDYAAFRERSIPFLFFSTGEHAHYHSPLDTAENLDYRKLSLVSRLICRLTLHAAQAETLPTWQVEPQLDLEEVRIAHRLLDKMLQKPGLIPEAGWQRHLASNACQSLQLILDRGTISAAERTWLANFFQSMMQSGFGQ